MFDAVSDLPFARPDVFAWHARPGAFERLSPPWQPVQILQEADSLRSGTAILRLPGGARWVARHVPEAYRPPARFGDELVTEGAGLLGGALAATVRWRHRHSFQELSPERTRMHDRVETSMPDAFLRRMFRYRHAQLAAELAAHERLRGIAGAQAFPGVVAMTGASGLVGRALAAFLTGAGIRVIRLVRGEPHGPDERRWDTLAPSDTLLDGVDAVIHLAGASIAGRFTEAHRARIRDSRIEPTRLLAERAASAGVTVFVHASAIGIYGPDRGDEVLHEDSTAGEGFLADLVRDWEAAAEPARGTDTRGTDSRVVAVRTGLVQSPRGGTLALYRPIFTAGLGGPLGDGRAWQSWIGLDDLVDVYARALVDPELDGAVNAVAPTPVRSGDYARTLARVLRRPALVPVPAFGPRLLLGREGSEELAEASQRVTSQVLLDRGHVFRQPALEGELRHILGHG